MSILAGDIKLLASRVMYDVPECGGGPTSTVIADGESNAALPDISDLDRAGGRVQAVQVHVSVQTNDTDTFLGARVIVAKPPEDPDVSITLISAGDTFSRRDAVVDYIDGMVTKSDTSTLVLREHASVGSIELSFYQRPSDAVPEEDAVLVIEAAAGPDQQFVRITSIVSSTEKTYPSSSGFTDVIEFVVRISEPLRHAFTGSAPNLAFEPDPGAARTYSTGKNDLAFAGVTPLAAPVLLGATTATATSIYARLVPDVLDGLPPPIYNPDQLSLDAVRLPSNGKVKIFRPGDFVVLGNTKSIAATVSNGQVIDCARVRLSRVRVIGSDGVVINTGYTADLAAGLVTVQNVSGWPQPVLIEHRIEDVLRLASVSPSGALTFTLPVTHDYPVADSYISTALVAGDLRARVSLIFDQGAWDGTWSDELIGDAATATFNDALAPILVTNIGSLRERWLIRMLTTTTYELIGEHVGVIGRGNTTEPFSPLNPATGYPYMTIQPLAFGNDWEPGNIVRFNIVGAMFTFWAIRTVNQGLESIVRDKFTLLVIGGVNRP